MASDGYLGGVIDRADLPDYWAVVKFRRARNCHGDPGAIWQWQKFWVTDSADTDIQTSANVRRRCREIATHAIAALLDPKGEIDGYDRTYVPHD